MTNSAHPDQTALHLGLLNFVSCIVVVLLFYVHGKHLRSCRDGQLTLPHFSWADLDLLSGQPVLRAHTFASN